MLHSQRGHLQEYSFARAALLAGEDSGAGKGVGRRFGVEHMSLALAG